MYSTSMSMRMGAPAEIIPRLQLPIPITETICSFSPLRLHQQQLQPQKTIDLRLSSKQKSAIPSCGNRRFAQVYRSQATSSSASAPEMAELSAKAGKKVVLLPIAEGSEEMEVVIVADILRRAGADVTVASVEKELEVLCSRNVKLVADTLISACEGRGYDLIVLPGDRPGAERLRDSSVLQKLTQEQAEQKRLLAAIDAAPAVALESWGLLNGLNPDSVPLGASESRTVETDGNLTTGRGSVTGFEFALSLVEQLYGKEKLKEVSTPLVLKPDGGAKPSVQEYNHQDWVSNADMARSFHVLMPIANGSEEMEVVIIVDVLRRAGMKVTVASVEEDLQILASRNVKIAADQFFQEVKASSFDLIVLPGGMPGAERLLNCEGLVKLLARQGEMKKAIGAICAAPAVVFEAKGFLKGKKATCHPAFTNKLSDQSATDGRVVIDGLTITSRGPGTAMEFALSIVEKVLGLHKAQSLAEAMALPDR